MTPLRELVQKAYAKSKKRTTKSIKSIRLASLGWNAEHEKAFHSLQEALKETITLTYPDLNKIICVHTDASDRFWAGVVTQSDTHELTKPKSEQQHEPLAFLGSEFKKAQAGWSTYEKEAYAIYQTFQRMDYFLIAAQDIRVYTDHRNLLYIFKPKEINPSTPQYVVSKVQRWALYLSQYQYTIEHVPGEQNEMADMISRWWKGYRRDLKVNRVRQMVRAVDIMPSTQDEDFIWPNDEEIKELQSKHKLPAGAIFDGDFTTMNDKIWIPPQATDMQFRLLVVAHTGAAGHRGIDATTSIIRERFYWNGLNTDVKVFVHACLH